MLRRQGTFGAREASLIGLDLCRAVAAVHRAGLLHGDIKAHNVMREEGGRTVLMDFGAGKDLDQDLLRAQVGGVGSDDFAGTPLYLAPEVFAGSHRTKATDVYSLGVLLFHLVTNRYPVEGQTRAAVEDAHGRGTHTHLRDLRPDLPDDFIKMVERALDPDPKQRFHSAGSFEIALARFLGAPAENTDSEPRRAFSIALAAVVVAVLLGTPAYYWWATRPATPPVAQVSAAAATPATAGNTGAASYSIDAGLYRISETGEAKLRPGDRVRPGDRLMLQSWFDGAGQIELAIGRLNSGRFVLGPVGELHGDGPRFADDVQVGRDQPVVANDEAGAEALLFAVAAGEHDDHDRLAGGFGELFNCLGFVGLGIIVGAPRANDE